MIVSIFRKIPPSISVPGFYLFLALIFLARFLFVSVFGALILTIIAYQYFECCTQVQPFNVDELIYWGVQLNSDYKAAFFAAMVTISGFVVAFHTATINWRNQMKAQLKIQAAGEIEGFFAVVTSNITKATIYIESLVETVNKIQQRAVDQEALFDVDYAKEKAGEFYAARNVLSQASSEIHRLIAKNHNLLSSGWGLLSSARLAAASLESITHSMWVHIPMVDTNNPYRAQDFVNQLNVQECLNFLEVCENNFGKLAGLSGGLQGYLLAPVIGLSVPMFINLLRNRKEFKTAISQFHKSFNAES